MAAIDVAYGYSLDRLAVICSGKLLTLARRAGSSRGCGPDGAIEPRSAVGGMCVGAGSAAQGHQVAGFGVPTHQCEMST